MMYSDKLVLAVKSNGKILREFKDTVYVPFGSEYSLLIKNLNSVRALVNITIDGTDVTPGGLVIYGNSECDLERYIGKNKHRGNKFKFIERSSSVENHRGVKLEDGIIRISFKFEQPQVTHTVTYTNTVFESKWPHGPYYPPGVRGIKLGNYGGGGGSYGQGSGGEIISCAAEPERLTKGSIGTLNSVRSAYDGDAQASLGDAGITVPGSESNQQFVTAGWFPTESVEHVMVLRMLGVVQGTKVPEPVTVQHKPKCVTCGKVNKANAKFCSNCGTALVII